MNRADVMRMVANRGGVDVPQAEKVVQAFLDSVSTALACGESVMIRRFGKFEPRHREAARRRNPRTGEMMEIPSTVSVGFKPAVNLRARLNSRSQT